MTATAAVGAPAATAPVDVAAPRYTGGWRIVARKELGDHVRSARFLILLVLLALAGLASVHAAAGPIRDAADSATQTPSIFLYLFTISPERVPAFHEFIAILGPLLGIAFGFDAINGERSQRTLARLVSQPIHRDEIINGKFVAGIGLIAMTLTVVVAVVAGYGALRLGIGPTWTDLARMAAFIVVTVVYVSVWLALAILLSVLTRRAATAALSAIGLWLVLSLFSGLIAGVIADAVHPLPSDTSQATIEQVLANARTELAIRRLTPDELAKEATGVLLNPSRQSTGIVVVEHEQLALPSTLSLRESLTLAAWQIVALVAAAVVLFAFAYVAFMRQEVRA